VPNNYDVIIIGSGVAGLYAALNLDQNLKILMLCKRELTLSNSALAQGGVAAVFDESSDDISLHEHDTFVAGGFKNDPKSLKVLVAKGPSDVKKLIDLGVDFDKDEQGHIHLTLEGGHSRHRILHHKDCTGREIVDKLILAVQQQPNITVLGNALVCDLKHTTGGFSVDVLRDEQHETYSSHYCVLCTGGIGRVYEYTTNSAIATGDGIALAYDLGAKIKNLSLVQFHPTAFANKKTRECFLISEAVRGEGAYLLNCNGERFMSRYDDRLELAPRDVVSKAIIAESKVTGSEHFYLDISHKDSEYLKNRFPMIYENLLLEGFDLTKDRVPIFPCQHYLMGGIDVDTSGRTTIDGLYAAGECSHTGVHGNNRLASNSLLEAIVFSHQVAEDINRRFDSPMQDIFPFRFEHKISTEHIPHGLRTEIRSIMQHSHFVVPDWQAAVKGYERICEIKKLIEDGDYIINADYVEARSLATVAKIILEEVI
jgi:L-aspartate oxidase